MKNIVLHGALHPAHPVITGFVESPLVLPALVLDAITGDYGTSTVFPAAAVYENRPCRAVVEYGENLRHLLLAWSAHAVHGDADIVHTQLLHSLLFGQGTLFTELKIDHGLHPQLGQALKALAVGPRAAVEVRIHFMEIGHPWNFRQGTRGGRNGQDNY